MSPILVCCSLSICCATTRHACWVIFVKVTPFAFSRRCSVRTLVPRLSATSSISGKPLPIASTTVITSPTSRPTSPSDDLRADGGAPSAITGLLEGPPGGHSRQPPGTNNADLPSRRLARARRTASAGRRRSVRHSSRWRNHSTNSPFLTGNLAGGKWQDESPCEELWVFLRCGPPTEDRAETSCPLGLPTGKRHLDVAERSRWPSSHSRY